MSYATAMKRKGERGFVALVAVIVLGLVLLSLSVEQSLAGWYARYNVLSAEHKEQANALAEGCADQALARLVSDPSFMLDGTHTITTEQGTCTATITADNDNNFATIASQGEVQGSFANLEMFIDLSSVHVGDTVIAPSNGAVLITMSITKDDGGNADLDDFDFKVSGGNPSSFEGSGAQNVVIPGGGSYQVELDNGPSGYLVSFSGNCDETGGGNVDPGEADSCIVSLDDVPTTITLIANVVNNQGGTKGSSDFNLTMDIDNDGDQDNVEQGTPISVTPGTYTANAGSDSEYTTPAGWEYDCNASGSVTVGLSEQKTCYIVYQDNQQPLACADTVMMLDRTGSMSSADLADEAAAAKAFLNLFKALVNPPPVGVGRFGISGSNSNAEVQSRGRLTSVYGDDDSGSDSDDDLYDAIEEATVLGSTVYTNLGSAISVGDAELNSARHRITDPKTKKVLILISDGEPNRPGCSGSSTCSASLSAATSAANAAKASHGPDNAPTSIYTIHFGSAGTNNTNKNFLASLSSGSSTYNPSTSATIFRGPTNSSGGVWTNPPGAHASGGGVAGNNTGATRDYFQFPFGNENLVPSGASIRGITVNADARSTANNCRLGVRLSWDGGTSWSSEQTQLLSTATSTLPSFGGSTNTWGHNWTAGEVRDFSRFRVRVRDVDPGTSCSDSATTYVDYLRVQVSYNDEQSENTDGDYFYVAPQASDMEDIFTEIGEKECPALDGTFDPPTDSTLTVVTKVIRDSGGPDRDPSDFEMTINHDGVDIDFDGADSPGISRQIDPGDYSVTPEPDSAYNISKDVNCSSTVLGDIAPGESRTCTITYNDKTPPADPPDLDIVIGSWREVPK